MTVLANEIHAHLFRTGAKSTVEEIMTRHKTTRKNVLDALKELMAAGLVTKDRGLKKPAYSATEQKPAYAPMAMEMRPYKLPKALSDMSQELQAHRAAFPSRFN